MGDGDFEKDIKKLRQTEIVLRWTELEKISDWVAAVRDTALKVENAYWLLKFGVGAVSALIDHVGWCGLIDRVHLFNKWSSDDDIYDYVRSTQPFIIHGDLTTENLLYYRQPAHYSQMLLKMMWLSVDSEIQTHIRALQPSEASELLHFIINVKSFKGIYICKAKAQLARRCKNVLRGSEYHQDLADLTDYASKLWHRHKDEPELFGSTIRDTLIQAHRFRPANAGSDTETSLEQFERLIDDKHEMETSFIVSGQTRVDNRVEKAIYAAKYRLAYRELLGLFPPVVIRYSITKGKTPTILPGPVETSFRFCCNDSQGSKDLSWGVEPEAKTNYPVSICNNKDMIHELRDLNEPAQICCENLYFDVESVGKVYVGDDKDGSPLWIENVYYVPGIPLNVIVYYHDGPWIVREITDDNLAYRPLLTSGTKINEDCHQIQYDFAGCPRITFPTYKPVWQPQQLSREEAAEWKDKLGASKQKVDYLAARGLLGAGLVV
ncbi:hypothetical protein CJU89_4994 [Yarrowia sp. B02]|nr:hypothetical protein CJU89_4994 [Yarrowia sp. B02]